MKKIIFLSLMLLLNTSTYAVTYCPQVITCDSQSCAAIPKDFYISAGKTKANTTYYFNHAIDGSRVGLGKSVACAYGDITISRNSLRADIDYPGSKWMDTNFGGIYVCHYNSDACPFKN
jgi:hypothetical protein